jgi:prephenate dehydrogenase
MPLETFEKVAILGPGLIGASIGLALKERKLAQHVVGLARTTMTLDAAVGVGALDTGTQDFETAITDADLLVIAAPVLASVDLLKRLATHSHLLSSTEKRKPLITDACSTKAEFVAVAEQCLPDIVDFCGGHPMAGRETAGPEAADAALFEGATWIVTPTSRTPASATERTTALAEALGAVPLMLAPILHDQLVAKVSHLPHMLSVALMLQAHAGSEENPELLQVAASGFRDMTRLAAGSAAIWRDVCLTNRDNIATELAAFRQELEEIEAALSDDSGQSLVALLATAHSARKKFING